MLLENASGWGCKTTREYMGWGCKTTRIYIGWGCKTTANTIESQEARLCKTSIIININDINNIYYLWLRRVG